jgi:cytoskeletal protein RodZ
MPSELKAGRIAAGLSIEEISHALKIKKQYLIALEEEEFEVIPGKVYVDGYRRAYAKFLGIDLPPRKISYEEEIEVSLAKVEDHKISQKYVVITSILMLVIIFTVYYL